MEPQPTAHRLSIALSLNAFVMPGSGHIFAGLAAKGYAIATLTTIFVILPLVRYTLTVMKGLQQLGTTGAGMARGLSTLGTAWQKDKRFILICLGAVALLWLYGIIDLVLQRRKLQRNTP